MHKLLIICSVLLFTGLAASSQQKTLSLKLVKKEAEILPGQIINFPFFITNKSGRPLQLNTEISVPQGWKVIIKSKTVLIEPEKQNFSVFTLQVPPGYPVGKYEIVVKAVADGQTLATEIADLRVKEIENISLQLLEAPDYILAGDTLKANYQLQNQGNTLKNVFIETGNCQVSGDPEIKLRPGKTAKFTVFKVIPEETSKAVKEFISVRAVVDEKVMESKYQSILVFPSKNTKKDLFHRFPVSLSATYISTNRQAKYQSAYQFELFGSGWLGPQQKHKIEFLARGPNNTNLSFLGMYDQYYLSYSGKNLEVFLGEKSFSFTPLTESSRFGVGTENKVKLNNGLFMGFLYVNPRFFGEIEDEYAIYTGFEKDRNNILSLYFIQKNNRLTQEDTYLGSLNTIFQPLKKTTVELELSRGVFGEIADNAYRTNINTQFLIFNLAGNYFYTGKNYPGFYSNSTFYSGNLSANLTSRLSIGVYAREDFLNAELDTFFVYAPYSKSFQTILNYNFANRSYLKFFWREFERKDRLALDKFHYKTRSVNAQINQKIKKFDYDVIGEIGNTTNYLLAPGQNKQQTYRASLNLGYRLNPRNAFRAFGSWSNINRFVSGEQRNLTAGLSATSKISKNFSANFHLQNAYNIDDYYRNRNLMQLNLDYRFLKHHQFTVRSFYTIFRRQTENPEFTFSATYTYNFGLPVKQLVKAGDLKGRITNENDEPVEGVIVNLLNESAVTNKNGEFRFPSIQPGRHLLSVDRSDFEIDEVTNIPLPIEVEILEEQTTTINFKITEGAKVTGRFVTEKKQPDEFSGGNIVIELASETEQFRISSSPDGAFSFPVVRPGNWKLKIYSSSIPKGYELNQTLYNLTLEPGAKKTVNIDLKPKKRNIIFKSQNISLSTSDMNKNKPVELSGSPKAKTNKQPNGNFYSIQVGAFSKQIEPNAEFFKGYKFDHEKKIGNYYIYFIGTFENREQAEKAKPELQKAFKGAFVVRFKNGNAIYR